MLHQLYRYLLSLYYVADSVLRPGDTMVTETGLIPTFREHIELFL